MSAPVTDLPAVAGVPECALAPELAARLVGADAPPGPWTMRFEAILWLHHASDAARDLVPGALRGTHLPLTAGAFINYLDTPVGAYHEVFGSPVILLPRGMPAGTVAFMVVDSLASMRGGRQNWSLPKTLGAFAWEDGTAARAAGDSPAGPWSISATAHPAGPPIPAWGPVWNRQATPDGHVLRISARARGRVKMASVDVASAGPTLPAWLLPGRHVGVVISRGRLRFGAARAAR